MHHLASLSIEVISLVVGMQNHDTENFIIRGKRVQQIDTALPKGKKQKLESHPSCKLQQRICSLTT